MEIFLTLLAVGGSLILTVLVLIGPKKKAAVSKDIIYHDRYIEIYPDQIVLNGFYLGPFGRKTITFKAGARIELVTLTFWKGRFRIQGTGDFKHWYAHDIERPNRQTCFMLHRRGKWWHIGFSAENMDQAAAIFREKGLLKTRGDSR